MIFYIERREDEVVFVKSTFYILPDTRTNDLENTKIYSDTSLTNHYIHVLNATLIPTNGIYYIYAEREDENGFIHIVEPVEFEFNIGSNSEVYIPLSRIERPIVNVEHLSDYIEITTSKIKPACQHTSTMYTILNQFSEVIFFKELTHDTSLTTLKITTDIANEGLDADIHYVPKLDNATSLTIFVAHGSNGFYSPATQFKTNGDNVRPIVNKRLTNIAPTEDLTLSFSGAYIVESYIVYDNGMLVYSGLAPIRIPANTLSYSSRYSLTVNFKSDGTYEPEGTYVQFTYILNTVTATSTLVYDNSITYYNIYELLETHRPLNIPISDSVGQLGLIYYSGETLYDSAGRYLTTITGTVNKILAVNSESLLALTDNSTYTLYSVNGTNGLVELYSYNSTDILTPTEDNGVALTIVGTYLTSVNLRGESTPLVKISPTSNIEYSIVRHSQTSYLIHIYNTETGSNYNYIYYYTSNVLNSININIRLDNKVAINNPDGIRYIDKLNGNTSLYKDNVFTENYIQPNITGIISIARTEASSILIQTETESYLFT